MVRAFQRAEEAQQLWVEFLFDDLETARIRKQNARLEGVLGKMLLLNQC
jgi:predicted RNase H-like HicB family nuclease